MLRVDLLWLQKKGVVAAASAKRLHSNALLSVYVKENVPQTDQKRITISHVACISTEQVMQKCVVYPIGLSVFAISLLCNYFKVAAVLRKSYREQLSRNILVQYSEEIPP